MAQYIVIHEPKLKFRQQYVVVISAIEATTKTDAVRKFKVLMADPMDKEYKAPHAYAIIPNMILRA